MLSTFALTADNNALNNPYFPTWTLLSIRFVYAWGTPRWRIVTVAKLLVTWVKPSNRKEGVLIIKDGGAKKDTFYIYNSRSLVYISDISSSFHQAQGFLLSFSWSKLDRCFLKPTVDIFELNFMISWDMVSDKVIGASASLFWLLRDFNVSSHLLSCYDKRRLLQSRMTSLHVMYCFR